MSAQSGTRADDRASGRLSAGTRRVDEPRSLKASALAVRVRGEFGEMPGLRLTVPQAARLFGVAPEVAHAVLDELRRASVLTCSSSRDVFARRGTVRSDTAQEGTERRLNDGSQLETPAQRSLRNASADRLACLLRHWTWADEAMARFERELAGGWEYDEIRSPIIRSVRTTTGVRCCAASAKRHSSRGFCRRLQLDAIRRDLEASLPGLRACRQLLVVIPASLEEQPRVVDLLRDEETLGRLRRVHKAFGEALREERMSREIDSLDH